MSIEEKLRNQCFENFSFLNNKELIEKREYLKTMMEEYSISNEDLTDYVLSAVAHETCCIGVEVIDKILESRKCNIKFKEVRYEQIYRKEASRS